MILIKSSKCRFNNPSFWDSFKFCHIISTFHYFKSPATGILAPAINLPPYSPSAPVNVNRVAVTATFGGTHLAPSGFGLRSFLPLWHCCGYKFADHFLDTPNHRTHPVSSTGPHTAGRETVRRIALEAQAGPLKRFVIDDNIGFDAVQLVTKSTFGPVSPVWPSLRRGMASTWFWEKTESQKTASSRSLVVVGPRSAQTMEPMRYKST